MYASHAAAAVNSGLPPGFRFRQPPATKPIGGYVRQVRLDIEDGRAVQHVDTGDAKAAPIAAEQFDDRQSDRVRALRRTGREHAVRPIVRGWPRGELDAVDAIEHPENVE